MGLGSTALRGRVRLGSHTGCLQGAQAPPLLSPRAPSSQHCLVLWPTVRSPTPAPRSRGDQTGTGGPSTRTPGFPVHCDVTPSCECGARGKLSAMEMSAVRPPSGVSQGRSEGARCRLVVQAGPPTSPHRTRSGSLFVSGAGDPFQAGRTLGLRSRPSGTLPPWRCCTIAFGPEWDRLLAGRS